MSVLADILHERTSFDFVGRHRRWFVISTVAILVGLASLLIRGLNLSIDFTGGTAWQAKSEGVTPSIAEVRNLLGPLGLGAAKVTVLSGDTVRVQAASTDGATQERVREQLAKYLQVRPDEVSLSEVGPTWGEQVSRKALRALAFFFVAIAIYLSLRFEYKMALASIVAVVHDILVTVGTYSLLGFEVSPATVIAFLTILGFSLYDGVVVFDKVDENVSQLTSSARETYSEAVNRSMNQVLMRSLNTSIVAVLPVLSLLLVGSFLLGAVTLRDFALALAVGLFTGAYSSIFVATPLLALWKEREPRYRTLRERVRARAATGERPGSGGGSGGRAIGAAAPTTAALTTAGPTTAAGPLGRRSPVPGPKVGRPSRADRIAPDARPPETVGGGGGEVVSGAPEDDFEAQIDGESPEQGPGEPTSPEGSASAASSAPTPTPAPGPGPARPRSTPPRPRKKRRR